MANYITTFDTHAEYNSATTLNYPNVSVINEDMSVIYAKEAPAFNGKYKFTLSDDSVISGECDATSAITSADTSEYKATVTDVIIGDCVTSIDTGAFSACYNLTEIEIPNSVTYFGDSVFTNCYSLTSVTIPSGVTSIGWGVFQNCSSLTSITVEATTPPTLSYTNAFNNTNNCPIYVPSESVETYKAATNWSTYADRIQAMP